MGEKAGCRSVAHRTLAHGFLSAIAGVEFDGRLFRRALQKSPINNRIILVTRYLHTVQPTKLEPVLRQPSDAKAVSRSSITNGSRVLPGVDGRSAWARRLRDLIALHIADLGGDEAISEAERSIVRRAATLTVELERLEVKFAQAGEAAAAELDLYQRTAANLRRLLESIGLERRTKDITPTLTDYTASKSKAA